MDKKEQLNRFLDKFLNDESIDFDELEVAHKKGFMNFSAWMSSWVSYLNG